MKRIISFLLFGLIVALGVSAQIEYRMVKGCVVDKNGNPIAGAEVIATGGGESVLTDADGSFRMSVHPFLKSLTASYAGYNSKKMKVRFDPEMMLFTLRQNRPSGWFINVLGGGSYNDNRINESGYLGLMGGKLSKWGYYVKGLMGIYQGEVPTFGVTAGVIKSIYKRKSFLNFGLGYAYYDSYYMLDDYWYWRSVCAHGMSFDLGYIYRPTNHFNINIGVTLNMIDDFRLGDAIFQAGVGYVF